MPLLAAASRRTRLRLAEHVERLRLPDGTVVVERGRPVQWIAIAVDGGLAGGGRSWGPGEAVFLGEGLLHATAPESVVTRGEVDLLYVPVVALTAAVTTDPVLGLAVARAIAGTPAVMPRRRRIEHRRPTRVATVRPAA